MSVWSGLAAAGIAIALAVAVWGQPLWEWRLDGPQETEIWSYGPFAARHTLFNKTTGNLTEDRTYAYAQLPGQPRMAAVFAEFGQFFLIGLLAAFGGIALAAVSAWKKIRGIFAGAALLASCATFLYSGLSLAIGVPPAATGDGLGLGGGQIPEFRGQAQDLGTGMTLTWTPVMGWIVVLAAGLAAAWGSSDLWHARPLRRATSKIAKASAPESPVRMMPPPPPPLVELVREEPPEPDIEEVFVIASNGLLVKHMSRSLMTDKDRDVVGGMISAISSFVREAFTERDGEVHEVTLGEHRFVMCSDPSLVVAVLVKVGETEDIVHRLRHLIALLKDRYADRLVNWQGAPLDGIEDELSVLWEPYHLPPPPAV